MPSSSSIAIALFLLFLNHYSHIAQCRRIDGTDGSKLTTYIVHVRPSDVTDTSTDSLEAYYKSFLPTTTEEFAKNRFMYSYTEVFSGFAARLTDREVEDMARKEGFVRAYRDTIIPLHTTHTPSFLGLQSGSGGGVWNASHFGEGVIIGVLDTGITRDHPSFNDEGMSPPPEKWKGICQFQEGCNNKLIGARAYGRIVADPSDDIGHGSHTASTAAGGAVSGVDAFELGTNVASGIAPKAHLAMYKVCQPEGCDSWAILLGLDYAVKDGVDVLSLSLGGGSKYFDEDPIAIGTFAAIQKGIVVVCSAGNDGPRASSISNEAPWILTVAASSVDRSFRSMVRLGNGKEIDGETLYQPTNFTSSTFPLVLPDVNNPMSADCGQFVNKVELDGSIVVCQSGKSSVDAKSRNVKESGGVGMININSETEGYTIGARNNVLPTVQVSYADGLDIVSYIHSTNSSTATITFGGTMLGTSPSPTVTFFSSRGPGRQSSILKPDITAPGLNILAAWNTKVDTSKGKFGYNVVSGTSMSAPHVSGIAALLKSRHPDWSPAAIKSAIMTTSDVDDRDGNPIKDEKHESASFYAMGAGHVNPTKAAEPGLVYDLDVDDYVAFLCGMGLGDSGVGAIVRRPNASCSGVKNITEFDLNYPSITVPFASGSTTVTRTVTNVGAANSEYSIAVEVPKGVSVTVEPETLRFSEVNEKKTFGVTVSASGQESVEGNLKWVSGEIVVRSPLIITNNVSSRPYTMFGLRVMEGYGGEGYGGVNITHVWQSKIGGLWRGS